MFSSDANDNTLLCYWLFAGLSLSVACEFYESRDSAFFYSFSFVLWMPIIVVIEQMFGRLSHE